MYFGYSLINVQRRFAAYNYFKKLDKKIFFFLKIIQNNRIIGKQDCDNELAYNAALFTTY